MFREAAKKVNFYILEFCKIVSDCGPMIVDTNAYISKATDQKYKFQHSVHIILILLYLVISPIEIG